MAKINPSLNLNKTPNLVESNTLVCAKNIRLLKDGSIGVDTPFAKIDIAAKILSLKTDLDETLANLNSERGTIIGKIGTLQDEADAIKLSNILYNYLNNKQYLGKHGPLIDNLYTYVRFAFYNRSQEWGAGGDNIIEPKLYTNFATVTYEEDNYVINVDTHRDNLYLDYIENTTGVRSIRFPYNVIQYIESASHVLENNYDYNKYFGYEEYYRKYEELVESLKDKEGFNNIFYRLPDITVNSATNKYEVELFDITSALYFMEYWFMDIYNNVIVPYTKTKESEYNSLLLAIDNYKKDLEEVSNKIADFTHYQDNIKPYDSENYNLLGEITSNNVVFLFYREEITVTNEEETNDEEITNEETTDEEEINKRYVYLIFKYNEDSDSFSICNCNWKSGLSLSSEDIDNTYIHGYCIKNLRNEDLLIIGEYVNDDIAIPIKSINLSKSSIQDDESTYTQNPIVNIINLKLKSYFTAKIRTGVYQFFIRYKLSEDFYTPWYVASKALYSGKHITENVVQGTINYVDINVDSDKGFILSIEKPFDINSLYKEFQLGFICSTPKDGTIYRSWKHFDINTEEIYFDYSEEDSKEISSSDLLNTIYGLYNVKNIECFKNKIYISNYTEHNFNPSEVKSFAANCGVSVKTKLITDKYYYDDTINNIFYYLNTKNVHDYITFDNIINAANQSNSALVPSIVRSSNAKILNITDISQVTDISKGSAYGLTTTIERRDASSYESSVRPATGHISVLVYTNKNNTPEPLDIVSQQDWVTTLTTILNTYNNICFNNTDSSICDISDGLVYVNQIVLVFSGLNEKVASISFDYDIDNIIAPNETQSNETLMPYQSYDFYVHLIKNTGEYTNGVKIGSLDITHYKSYNKNPLSDELKRTIYPVFAITSPIPDGYIGCFFSMHHSKNESMQLFNRKEINYNGVDGGIIYDSIELDTLLYTCFSDLKVKGITFEKTGRYYGSADPSIPELFGASGKVLIKETGFDFNGNDDNPFIVLTKEDKAIDGHLVKVTPYIEPVLEEYIEDGHTKYRPYIYDNHNDLQLNSFICNVSKIDYDDLTKYVSGSDIYTKSVIRNDGICIPKLTDLSDSDIQYALSIHNTETFTVYSNFNLNYLSLREDNSFETPKIKSFTKDGRTDTYLARLKDSFLLNETYEFNDCFYNFQIALYSPIDESAIYKFNNTIRSSNAITDEASISIFKFDATDYYNVPTNKGIIINLKAAGIYIFVHTEDGLFRFSGNNTISNNGGEDIALKEQESIFDTGVQEIFGSEYGFGGINKKYHAILTNDSYTFYDEDSNNLYTLKDNSQIKAISDNIRKLLDYDTITDLKFANDFYNDRLFIYITYSNSKYVTLSYNTRVENFVSIHDFIFDYAFNTKTRCYFIKGDEIFYKTKTFNDSLIDNNRYLVDVDNNLYPCYKETSIVSENEVNIGSRPYFDVILTDNYESIKTLNYINWICNEVESFIHSVPASYDNETEQDIIDDCVAEESKSKYAGNYIRIYTNVSATKLIELTGYDDTTGRRSINFYNNITKPYYDLGRWNFNYFRNALNVEENNADNKSLIYGNYIVVRFIFSNKINFKFDSINFNTNNNYETSFK